MTQCLPRRPLFHRPLPPHHCHLTHPLNPLNPPHFRRFEQSIFNVFDVLIIVQPSSSTRAPPPVEAPTTDRPGGICQRVVELKWQRTSICRIVVELNWQLRTTRFSFKDQYQPPRSPGRLASLFPLLISSFAKPPIKPILCRVISASTSPLPSPCPWTPASTYIPSPKVSRTRGFLRTKLS